MEGHLVDGLLLSHTTVAKKDRTSSQHGQGLMLRKGQSGVESLQSEPHTTQHTSRTLWLNWESVGESVKLTAKFDRKM